MDEQFIPIIEKALGLTARQVRNTLKLLDEGATIPFISRYRKEATGSLDEVKVGEVSDWNERLKELVKRKVTIVTAIEGQGKMTDELRKRIQQCWDATELEDLYLPYKPKRKTRAEAARQKGLEPLAVMLLMQRENRLEERVRAFVKGDVKDVDDALKGARDILAEQVSEDERARGTVRAQFARRAVITAKVVKGKEEEAAKFHDYFDFSEPLKRCSSHRLLAIRRGEAEGFLKVNIAPTDDTEALERLERQFVRARNACGEQVAAAVTDAYKRLLKPSIETEFAAGSKQRADEEAIRVFAANLRQLLLAPPLGQKRVLAIAIGNGTAGRETEEFVSGLAYPRRVQAFVVSEDGASVYSASKTAREEFPDYDVTVRGAVSIGRRLMDPLAELVKIDPKSIGVGQYQHDVDQAALKKSLDQTVVNCVNLVGVDVNTASKHLLTYVSGLGPQLAQNIVDYRAEHGPFTSRRELLQVPRMGAKAFEQCAGFLRIAQGTNPLDNTAVHPESYPLVERMASDMHCTVDKLVADKELRAGICLEHYVTENVGMPTLTDIMQELDKPGRDRRESIQVFSFDPTVRTLADLHEGMELPGIVTNITNFGCFVDVGIKENGLVHCSQLADRYVADPTEVVRIHQHVRVKVLAVDAERKRLSLSMKGVGKK